jgi:CheY-like chemotaxis protein
MQQPIQSPPRLLVLEDDEALRTIVVDVLSEEGYAVTGASSLEAALAQVNTQVFALILADVIDWKAHAPLQAVERLKSQAHPMPVGLITGWNINEETIKEKGFACAAPGLV